MSMKYLYIYFFLSAFPRCATVFSVWDRSFASLVKFISTYSILFDTIVNGIVF